MESITNETVLNIDIDMYLAESITNETVCRISISTWFLQFQVADHLFNFHFAQIVGQFPHLKLVVGVI